MDQIQSLGGPLLSLDVRTSGLSLQHQPNCVDLNIGRLKPQQESKFH